MINHARRLFKHVTMVYQKGWSFITCDGGQAILLGGGGSFSKSGFVLGGQYHKRKLYLGVHFNIIPESSTKQ